MKSEETREAPADPIPSQADLERMTLHLANCSARDEACLKSTGGTATGWASENSDAWRAAGLSAWKVECLERFRDGSTAATEWLRCQLLGVRLVQHDAPDYPEALHHLYQPPILLSVRGRWPIVPATVAVVGSRAATNYGRQSTRMLSSALAEAGYAIVSGLARGVDRYALESALDVGGWPIAVLGTGIDMTYPPENRALQAAIAERGTLISEFPLGRRPDRLSFPRRNRVIAALARQVLVVEAGSRSGALITVGHALELGRDVLAVPGPIDSELSAGCNKIIEEGATPIIDLSALMYAVRGPMPMPDHPSHFPSDPLLAALGRRTLGIDELAEATGRSAREVLSGLVALELQGLLQRLPGGLFAVRTPAVPGARQR